MNLKCMHFWAHIQNSIKMFTKIILLHVPEKLMNSMRDPSGHLFITEIIHLFGVWGLISKQPPRLCKVGFTNRVLIDEPGTISLFTHPPLKSLNPAKFHMMVGPGPSWVLALIQYDQWAWPSFPDGLGQIHLVGQASKFFKSKMLIWPAPFLL